MKNDAPIDEKKQEQETPKSLLEELIREGARRLLQAAIEQEVTEYLERFREEKDDKGHRMVVRNGRRFLQNPSIEYLRKLSDSVWIVYS